MEQYLYVYGLLMGCPYGSAHPLCPLKKLRCLSDLDRFRWAKTQSPEGLRDILRKHINCDLHGRAALVQVEDDG